MKNSRGLKSKKKQHKKSKKNTIKIMSVKIAIKKSKGNNKF
jgi:hypothetical protein